NLHIARIAVLATGAARSLRITGDFADQQGVELDTHYVQVTSSDPATVFLDANGRIVARRTGTVLLSFAAQGIVGANAMHVADKPKTPLTDEIGNELDLFPPQINLAAGSGQRQIDVHAVTEDGTLGSDATAKADLRYVVSDPRIASVSDSGLIKAKAPGVATVTVIQGARQGTIQLRVVEPVTGPSRVDAKAGAVVQDSEGNALMIAAGALPKDVTASIATADLDTLGIPRPASEVLRTLGAVQIAIDGVQATHPMQLALKVTPPVNPISGQPEPLAVGSKVLFWRWGEITLADGSTERTWWLVDDGVIGDDGLAHTASPPYSGLRVDGVYALTAAPEIDEQTGRFSVEGHVINVDAIWERQAMITVATGIAAGGFGYGAALATFIAGQAAAYSQEITAFAYNFAGTYQRTVPVSQATPEFFKSIPAGPLPEGDTTIDITGLSYDKASRTLKLTGSNFLPKGQSAANFAWTIDLEPRGNQVTDTTEGQPDRGIVWQRFDAQLQSDGSLTTVLPVGVALSQHVVGITRHILVPDGNGIRQAGESEESEAVEAWDDGTHKTIAATPEGIKVYGPSPAGPGKPIVLMGDLRTDEQGQALQIARGASQGVVYSDDGTLAYVAGRAGRIYVVDLDVDSVVATIRMNEADGLISALALSGNWLYVARTSGLSRIYADQLSSQFLKMEQSLRLPGYEKMTGFVGLAISADSYLGVTARPLMGRSADFVAFVDLNQIRYDGNIAAAAIVVLDRSSYPQSGLGKEPVYITTGPASGQFILCNRGDYDQGIAGITLKFDDSGQINAATKIELQSVRLTGRVPDTYLGYDAATQRTQWDRMKTYHEDIQAASGAVVLDYDGETYAIVADFNLWFNDDLVKYWGTDEVPHTQIGGKVGVIKNPFGRDGRPPVYLGATTPIVGSAVGNVSLAADGTVYADVWNYQPNLDMNAPMSHSLYAWNAPRLIQGALTAYARDPQRTYPLDRDLPSDPHSSQPPPQIPELTPNRYDDIGNGRPFEGWINLGNYQEPGVFPAFGKTVVRPPAIVLSPLEPRVRLTAGLEGTGWDYVVGGINLLTGGYMERADQRMFKYHT
ncbi:MAG TPA: Ig-like domain-containing protein, partial [Accumulibacter sp.]|uniref:Ig-like domain-containing protein n=1 Tax=Accumulibacter sp. TaxID=2053492 RepID=UPI002C47B215